MSSYRALHDGWLLSGADHVGVPATVPGCVHTDLLAAGNDFDLLPKGSVRSGSRAAVLRWLNWSAVLGWLNWAGCAGPAARTPAERAWR